MNEKRLVYPDNKGAIFIRGDKIAAVGWKKSVEAQFDEEIRNTPSSATIERIDLTDRWLIPGLINTHVHTSQQLGRGLGDDVNLITWLHERIWPYESSLTEEDQYISTLLCCLELIRSGVTCFAEAGGQHVHKMAEAVKRIGIRACLARSSMDTGEGLPPTWCEPTDVVLAKQQKLFDEFHNTADGRIRVWFAIRTIFNASDKLLRCTKEEAIKRKVGIHMHVAEIREEVEFCEEKNGATTVRHLEKLGVLGPHLLAVHSVWLHDDELSLFANQRVSVSHCPSAAMRYLGFARVPEMLDKGVLVTIGTDGAPANNRMTLIDDMWMCSSIHKGKTLNQQAVPAERVLEMATVNGAKALLWDNEIGSLKPGMKADIVVVNPNTANMLPLHDAIANFVSSMQARNVESVMINGSWILKDGVIVTVDEKDIISKARTAAAEIRKRAGIKLPVRFPVADE